MCFILVRTEPDAPKHQGISYLLMPMDAEGIDRRPIKQMTGDSDFNELFLTDVSNELIMTYSDKISWTLYTSYISFQDMCLLIFLCLLPIWYSMRFWCAELLIIDRDISIKNSLINSYSLTRNPIQLILLGLLLIGVNLFCILLGYIFFMIGLTISYIIILLYYRYLKSTILHT